MAPLTVMNWNTRSVRPKTNDLVDLLQTYNIDVAVLTETHLEPRIRFPIARYNIVRRDRTHGLGGGVAILVRDTINFRKLPDTETSVIESLGVELEDAAHDNLRIYAAYCPRQCKYIDGSARQFQCDLGKLTRGKFLICCDLNARHERWNNSINNINGKLLLKRAQVDYFTVHFPEQPTFISPAGMPSTLDIFLANFEINKPLTIENRHSDHYPVICKINRDFVERLLNYNGSIFQAIKGLYQAVGGTVETFWNMINFAIGSSTNIEGHSNDEITDDEDGERDEENEEVGLDKPYFDVIKNEIKNLKPNMINFAIGSSTNIEGHSNDEITDDEVGESDEENEEVCLDKPYFEDIKDEIKKLKQNNATSKERLPSRLFKHGINALAEGLHMIITKIWQEDTLRPEWIENEVRDRIICKKIKTSPSVCCLYRAPDLLDAAYRVLSGILFCRLSSTAYRFIGKYRAGSSTEAIFTLRQVLQKCREFNVPTHHLFLDLSDVLNTVDRDQLWQIMDEYGLPTKLTRLIKATMTRLMNYEVTSNNSKSKNGLLPGCALSNLLCRIAVEGIVRRARVETGGTIFQKNVQLISFDGDMDLIARSLVELKKTYAALKMEANRVGLIIISEKVKYMRARGSKEDSVASSSRIILSGDVFESVDEYIFLDSLITTDNDTSKEIERRILAGERAYVEHLEKLESTRRSKDFKLDIYRNNIRPVILDGHEAWTMLEKDQTKLNEFEHKVLRRICNIAAQNFNRMMLNELLGEASIVQKAKVDRLQWAGCVIIMSNDSPVRMVLKEDPSGTRKRGSQRARWINHVEADLKSIQIFENLWKLAKDPEKWDQVIKTAKCKGL